MNAPIEMPLIEFLCQCRRPLHYKTAVNKLRNFEALSLGGVRQSLGKPCFAYGQAYVKKLTKGQYTFVGLWTLPTKPTRQDCWIQGTFTLHKGVMHFEQSVTTAHLRGFFKVCRYLGVHKRIATARYRHAYQAHGQALIHWQKHWQAVEEEYATHPDPVRFEETLNVELGSRPRCHDFGCWFFANNYAPLFDGEVLPANPMSTRSPNLDIRDRILTHPWRALNQKRERK
ncbi:hypothetical protein PUN50_26940 (plasmid) [Vibrio campbellii]|uniref:Uncharacterized protein n=1 Tax=Vibrio campbellii TaxID=680 RepID=A0AAQ2Y5J1_9VIBR|nr:hypothetical protein [Vibrio campbellii]WDG12058.1 hypothetical protein PUN50_26940 [Vibrio campbellii]